MTFMTKRSKTIVALAAAMALVCASVSAEGAKHIRAIDLPYIDVSNSNSNNNNDNHRYEDYSSPPIWTNTKDNDRHNSEYCGPGEGRSVSRCPGLGRGGHSFPGHLGDEPGAGPGDWNDNHHRRHLRRRQLRERSRRQLAKANTVVEVDQEEKKKKNEKRGIIMPDSNLHLDDVHLAKRGLVNWPNSDLHLEDVHVVEFEKRQDTYYDPENDPEPDIYENDVRIYKRGGGGGGDTPAAPAVAADAGVVAVEATAAAATAESVVKVKRSVVIYDDKPHLLENAESFGELMPSSVSARKLKKRQDVEDYEDDDEEEEAEADGSFDFDVEEEEEEEGDDDLDFSAEEDEEGDDGLDFSAEEDEEGDDGLDFSAEEDEEGDDDLDFSVEEKDVQDNEEDEEEERRQDDEAGVQDWIEEMRSPEAFELEDGPDGQTPSEEEIFAAQWESA
ncbi:hypothetical protein DFQ27_005034 [Actinomortierella ambigua]|uniref:Uncharacterized protein n=1 Tax=Actinomortierella ambigua TaxID=1343610 RepID=A0A9P6PZX8_9FUNG|nr:hypothetical protein DFQ27_005034 [Actinomortierella ambigua]